MNIPRIVLLPRRARPFYGRHPWVYAGAIAEVQGEPQDGDVVDLVSHAGNFVARGLFNSQSKIRVRLYSWSPEIPLETSFFRERLLSAIRLRDTPCLWPCGHAVFKAGNSSGFVFSPRTPPIWILSQGSCSEIPSSFTVV